MPVVKDMEITCSALSRTSKKKGQRMSSHGYCAHSGAPSAWDSRPVLPPSQLTLSRQIMKNWEPWKVTIEKSNNHRMLEQMAFRIQHSVQTTGVFSVTRHIKRRTNDNRLPQPLRETWFCSSLGVPIPALVVHKITPVTGNERGDVEITDYVIPALPVLLFVHTHSEARTT